MLTTKEPVIVSNYNEYGLFSYNSQTLDEGSSQVIISLELPADRNNLVMKVLGSDG